MLNLLISVISDTYDRVQMESVPTDYKVKCEMLREVQTIMSVFTSKAETSQAKYMRYMKILDTNQEDE